MDVKNYEEGEESGSSVENSVKPPESTSASGLVVGNLSTKSCEEGGGSGAVADNSDKPSPEKPSTSQKSLGSNGSGVGNMSAKNMFVRADMIDFKKWDVELENRLSRVWSRETNTSAKREEWEIDLAKLDLEKAIAQGAFGSVYKAVYDGQDVAVKVLDWGEEDMMKPVRLLDWGEDVRKNPDKNAILREAFRNEVAVWHKLDHPNVTKFIGASMGTSNLTIPPTGSSNGGHNDALPTRACCVVVEYLAGGTLKDYLIKNIKKKLPLKVVIQLALDLARGLSYLHSKAIAHRDVKTENMLLDTNRTLKIADFGVARVEAKNLRDMTGETGTPGYMAPEVLDGKPYSRKCDVYSFGICLWEMYCCDMPYFDFSPVEVSYAVLRQNLRPEMPRCCPAPLASIMCKCWDPNPDKRPNMDEVVRLLGAIDTTKGGGMIPGDQVVQSCFCFGPPRGP